jgi:hypothetical protein
MFQCELQNHCKSVLEYIQVLLEILPSISKIKHSEALNSGLVSSWIDLASRESELAHFAEERAPAFMLLSETWLLWPEISKQTQLSILLQLSKGLTDPSVAVRSLVVV